MPRGSSHGAKHAKPLLASKKLEKFTADDVDPVYDALKAKKVGGRTIQVVGQTMRSGFDAAIRRRKFLLANPWRAVRVPKHEPKEAGALTEAEAKRFIRAARGDRFEALWLLSLLGGCRLGECLGLEWQDVDFTNGRFRIRQEATEVGGVTKLGKLKTKSSQRVIDVGKSTIEALRRRRKAADAKGHGSTLVFTTETGGHIGRSNLRRRQFASVCKKAEIAGLRIHDLKHSMTSYAIAGGLSPIVVAARPGHKSTRMTLDRYSHLLPGQQREAADPLVGCLTSSRRRHTKT